MIINVALIGSIVTITIFLATVIFRMGHQAARIEELENWRKSIRIDMHEISDHLADVREELRRLGTLIEERTQRRRLDDILEERDRHPTRRREPDTPREG